MISRTFLKERTHRKTSPVVSDTLRAALKHDDWLPLVKVLSGPTRRQKGKNLSEINAAAEEGDVIVVPGKVLAGGKLSKKIKVCALSISAGALEKVTASKSEFSTILEEIENNKTAKGVKLLP